MMCPSGTPDILSVVRNKLGGISLIFFEIKKPGGKVSKEQLEFFDKYKSEENVFCYIASHPKEIDMVIKEIGIDKLKELTYEP